LKKSKNYISIEEKFKKYVEEVEIAKPNYSYKLALFELEKIIKKENPNFTINNLIFKNFENSFGKDFCYRNGKTFFSHL
jgi:hypothetical protein